MSELLLPCAVAMIALAGSCIAGEVELPARLLFTTTNAVTGHDADRLTSSGETHRVTLPGLIAVFGISNSLPRTVFFTKQDGLLAHGFVEVPQDGGWHTRLDNFIAFAGAATSNDSRCSRPPIITSAL